MKPLCIVQNNGQTFDYSALLIYAEITDETKEQADQFTVRLSDVGNSIALPKKGEKVQITLGMDGVPFKSGLYIVDEVGIEGPPDIIAIAGAACPFTNASGAISSAPDATAGQASGATWLAMQTRKSRSFDETTLGEIVQSIAAEHGLTPACDSELSQIQIEHLDQTNESNLNLLTRLARDYGAVFKPVNGALAFARMGAGVNLSTGSPLPVVPVVRGLGMKWKCIVSKRTDFDGVQCSYTDPENGGITKADLEDAVRNLDPAQAKLYLDGSPTTNAVTAKHKQKSRLKGFKMGSCGLELNLPGGLAVTAEQKLSLSGFREEVNGVWIAKKIVVSVSKETGLRTRIEADTPGDGSEPREGVAEDPEGDGDGSDEESDAETDE